MSKFSFLSVLSYFFGKDIIKSGNSLIFKLVWKGPGGYSVYFWVVQMGV